MLFRIESFNLHQRQKPWKVICSKCCFFGVFCRNW